MRVLHRTSGQRILVGWHGVTRATLLSTARRVAHLGIDVDPDATMHSITPTHTEVIPMLILHRHAGERIRLGDDGEIVITVLEFCRNGVRLGIDAPATMPVHREEVWLHIQSLIDREECNDDDDDAIDA